MIETRHGLESNPVPTSILSFIAILALLGSKMDVGTGLDSRLCLVSIIYVPGCLIMSCALKLADMLVLGSRSTRGEKKSF